MREKHTLKRLVILSLLLSATFSQQLWAQNTPPTSCEVTLEMYDQYGDGWNNAALSIYQHDSLVTTATMTGGSHQTLNITLDVDSVHLFWQTGWFDGECTFYFINEGGDTLFASRSTNEGGMSEISDYFGSFLMACPTCMRANGLHLISRTSTQLVVGWNGEAGATWWVEYAAHGTSSWTRMATTGNTVTINNLTPGQVETVRVSRICAAGDTSGARTMNFITQCTSVGCSYTVRLFDRSGMEPPFGGSYILVMHNSGAVIDTIRMPSNTAFDTNDYLFAYNYNLQTCVDTIAFGYHTDSAYTMWGRGITVFNPEGEDVLYVPVQEIEGNDGSNYAIPYYCPTCLAVRDIDGRGLDSTRAIVTWRPNGGTQFLVEYGPSSADRSTYTTLPTNDTTLLLTGLTIYTQYKVYVRSLCGVGDTSAEREVWVTTGPRMKGSRLYVSNTSNTADNPDGTSWANAYYYISEAVQDANLQNQYYGNHPEVWVAEGTYYPYDYYSPVFNLYPSINVYGGFAGNEPANYDISQRDIEAHPTILRANYQWSNVVSQQNGFSDSTRGVMDGFIAEGGYYGGAFYSNAVIRNCTFRNNQGGVSLNGDEYSGLVYMDRCKVINNQSQSSQTGIYASYAVISNTLIANNVSQNGEVAGLQLQGNTKVIHCDIVNNQSGTGYGVRAVNWNGSHDTIYNSIIWNNRPHSSDGQPTTAGTQIYSEGALTLHYSATSDTIAGTGNIVISKDNWGGVQGVNYVNFNSPDGGDYRLNGGSACIDAGWNTGGSPVGGTDLAGNNRLYGNAPDMGCYENDGTFFCLAPTGVYASDRTLQSATIHWSATVAESYTLEYALVDSDTWTTISNLSETQYTLTGLSQYTDYKVRVTAMCNNGTSLLVSDIAYFRTACEYPMEGLTFAAPTTNQERTTNYIPINLSYTNSGSYILIRSDELGGEQRIIDTIGFHFLGTDRDRDLVITMYSLDHDYLYWQDTANMTNKQVLFRGTAHLRTATDDNPWSMIPLQRGFHYDGTGAIVIQVEDTTGSYSGYAYFKAYWTQSTNNLIYYSYTKTSITYRPYMYLSSGCDLTPCPKPRFALDTATSSSASFTCSRLAGTPQMEYKLQTATEYTVATNVSFTDSSCVLSGLQPNKNYDVHLRRICPSDDTSEWVSLQLTTAPLYYTHIYVKADAIGANDGTTWSNAFTDLGEAVSAAYACGQFYGVTPDVYVAAGVYYGNTDSTAVSAFTVLEGVKVYGGFAGSETNIEQRPLFNSTTQQLNNSTILDGQNLRPVLYQQYDFNDAEGSVWDGFTIQGGVGNSTVAGGVTLRRGTLLRNSVITGCDATESYGYPTAIHSSGAHFDNCTVTSCSNSTYTSTAIINSQNSIFTNCQFKDNNADGDAFRFNGDTIRGCIISGNTATSELAYLSSSFMENSLIWNNSAYSTLFYIQYSSTVSDCDFVCNRSNYGTPIQAWSSDIRNSILWGNSPSQLGGIDSVSYCAVQGGYAGTGNINLAADNLGNNAELNYPSFVSPEDGDFRLASFSPCVDAGRSTGGSPVVNTDLAGNPRVYGDAPDMGCYEYNGENFCLRPMNVSVERASSAALVSWMTPQGVPSVDVEYKLESENEWTVLSSVTSDHVLIDGLTTGMNYQVRLRGHCGSDFYSPYTAPIGFVTGCTQYGYTLVGDSNSLNTNSILPTYTAYYYGYTQQLFLASELSLSNAITAIQLQATNNNSNRQLKIYLGHTSQSSFTSGNDAIPSSAMTLVFDGTARFSSDSLWSTIPLTMPFTYNGTDNLVLVVIDNSGEYSGYTYFGNSYTNDNMSLYGFGYEPYSIDSSYTLNVYYIRNNVRFVTACQESSCPTPLLDVQNITDTSATVICQTGLGQRVQLQYKRSGDESYTTLTATQEQTLSGLRQNTTYHVRARTICLGDTSQWNIVTFSTPARRQNIFYVSASGTATANASSWQEATSDLNWAVRTAKAVNDTYGERAQVWVAQGTYYGNSSGENAFEILANVDVYGGFAGTETSIEQRQLFNSTTQQLNNSTILDGQNQRRVLYQASSFQSGDSAVWDGFTITGGNALNLSNTSGGGAYLQNGATLSHSIVKNCFANYGGGIYMNSAKVLSCAIVDDSAYSGGGIVSYYNSIVDNCLIANNSAQSYGGINLCSSTMTNCNVVANRTYNNQYANSFEYSQVYNSIVWGNKTEINYSYETYQAYGYSTSFHNCAFEEEWPSNSTHTDCLLLDDNNSGSFNSPLFVQPCYAAGMGFGSGGDWTLQQGSILIDRGRSTGGSPVGETDLAGNARVQAGVIDMGCYESPYSGIELPSYSNGVVYVVEGGAGQQDGTSWSNAMGDINSALTMAAINGGLEVWVAQGTYYGNTTGDNAFTMLEGVNLYGGFTGTETDFSQRPSFNSTTQQLNNSTILDGANSRRVLKQKYNFDTLTVWDGFTLQNGFVINNVGAAAVLKGGSQLRNCIIQNNINYFTTSNNRYGGAIKIEGGYSYADTTLWGCTVRNNYSQGQDGSTPYVYGYALYAGRTNIVNCLFYDNRGYDAAVNLNNNAQMFNSVISNNQGNYCAGMNLGSGTSVYNCVVAQNVSEHSYGGVKGNGSLYNSIIWGNKHNYTANNLSNYLNLYNCAVEGGYEDGTNVMTLAATNDGTSGSLNYVRFIDPTQNDFRLHPASHCLDQGDTSFTHLGYALDGTARILGAAMDIGAYESETSATCPSPINMRCTSVSGTTATFAWTPLGSESQWRFTITGASDGLDSTITVSDTTLTVGNLRLNHTYTAYVRAICSGEYSAHSPQVTLSTLCDSTTLTPLSAFTGMYPADSSIVVGQRASFSWDNVPEATSYDFYIWRDDQSVPDEPTATGITLDGVSNILIPNYKRGCFYHWKVVAWNQCIKRSSAVQTIELDPLPDLHVTNVTFSQPIANQPLTVTWTVRNDGRGATPQGATWYDRIWIVSDVDVRLYDTHDNEGRIPGCENLQGLAPGESYTNSQTFIVPRGLIGNYYIFVFADQTDAYNINFSETGGIAPDPYTPSVTGDPYHFLKGSVHQGGNIPEVEDNDNFFYKSFYIMPPPTPDLTVTHIGHPTQAFSNSDITVMWTVSNVGDAQAGGRSKWFDDIYIQMGDELNMAEAVRLSRVKHWAGEDSCYQVCHACSSDNPNCNPCHIECWPKGIALQPDSSYTVSKTVRIPIQFAGEYSIFVVTDATDTIYESIYETNNTVLSEQHINVIMTPLADLEVSNVSMPLNVSPRQLAKAHWTVTNNGAGATELSRWYDRLYFSPTPTFNSSTAIHLVEKEHNGVLEIDGSYTDSASFYIPKNLSGNYYLIVKTDSRNEIFENLGEDNNFATNASPTQILLPDLRVTQVIVPELQALGEDVTVSAWIKNIGPGTAYAQNAPLLTSFAYSNITHLVYSHAIMYPGDSILLTNTHTQGCPGSALASVTVHTNHHYYNSSDTLLEANGMAGNILTATYPVIIPDAVATDFSTADSAWSGKPVNVTWKVTNGGITPLEDTIEYSIFISNSATSFSMTAANRVFSTPIWTSLMPDSSVTFSGTAVLPNGISGDYYLHLVIDTAQRLCDGDRGNNMAHSAAIHVSLSPWPDLVVASITAPDSMIVGGTAQFDVSITNQGIATATGRMTTKVFMSVLPVYNAGSTKEVASQQNTIDLGVNETTSLVMSGIIPPTVSAGHYYFYAVTDFSDDFYEHTGEDNNITRSNQTFVQIYPLDLVVDTIMGPDTLNWGQTARYCVRMRNNSNVIAAASQWFDRLYFNTDGDVSSNTYSGITHSGGLGAGASYVDTFYVTMPYGPSGDMVMTAICDYNRNNPDIAPLNNQLSKSVAARSVPTPDLQVSNVEILDSVVSGQPFRLAYSVTNISSTLIDSLSWNDKITLSDVNGYTSWSMQLSLYPRVKYLDSGWFYRDTVTVTIPVPNQGSRFLLIHANAQNTFYEADQTNNVVAVPVNITLPPPGDLTVTNITHSDSVLTGTSTTVRWNVKNIGNNSISGQRLSSLVYLSRDNIFSSDDKLLGTINSTSVNLAPGDSVVQQASVMISGQGEGNRYFIVKTDVRNAFHEDDENNNTVAAAEPIFVMLRELPFNTTVTDTLYATRILDYKLDVGTHRNETVRISLETADSLNGAINNIYVAYNTVGNSLSSTYSSFEQYAANPEVFIPSTRTGYYGVSIEGSIPSRQPQVVQLRADILPFELRSINPTYGGNNGMVTIELNGSRFRPDMDVWMEKGGDTLRPVDLNFVSYYQAYARFNLSGADTGDYNIGLFNFCEGEVSMDSAFHISAPSPDGLGYNIIFPNSPRPNRTITMVLEFGNLGNTDIENVVLEVESVGGTYISLTPEGLREHGTTVQIPLNIPGEPEGLLRPGIRGTVTFYGYTAGSIVFVTRRVEE